MRPDEDDRPGQLEALQAIEALRAGDVHRGGELLESLDGIQQLCAAAAYAKTWLMTIGVPSSAHVGGEVRRCGKPDCPDCSDEEGEVLSAFIVGVQNDDKDGVMRFWAHLSPEARGQLLADLAAGLVGALQVAGL